MKIVIGVVLFLMISACGGSGSTTNPVIQPSSSTPSSSTPSSSTPSSSTPSSSTPSSSTPSPTQSTNFTPTDVRLGDVNTNYLAIEFSPDFRYMGWVEGGAKNRVWLCGVDPNSGDLIPPDGKGLLISDGIEFTASPQWGQDSTGVFFMTLDQSGRLVMVRPQSSMTAAITILPTVADSSRSYPYPASLPQSANSSVVYAKNDTMGNLQAFYLDLASPTIEKQVTFSPISSVTNTPPFLTTIFRWFGGLPIFTYGDFNNGLLRIQQLDISQPVPQPLDITNDLINHVDDFPFIFQGQRYLVGGANAQAVGNLYRQQSNGFYSSIQTFALTTQETGFNNPVWLSSIEPFQRQGKIYASFQVLDNGSPTSAAPGQIWVMSLFEQSLKRMVSLPQVATRRDPEFFVGNSKVWIYYYGRELGKPQWELHRAETGL